MITQAVILAAGKGTRIRESDDDLPKPLHRVGEVPLLKRTILTLAAAGITKVVVVTGFLADQIAKLLDGDPAYAAAGVTIELVHNPDYEKSNGISVLVGGRAVTGPFVLSMADHIYTPSIATLVASQNLATADLFLATDPKIKNVPDLADATKVHSYSGRIVDIGKQIEEYDRIDCGVFAVTQRLLSALEEVRAERGDCSLSEGVRRLAQEGRARVVDIKDGFWHDVDTQADRELAEAALGRHDPLAKG